MAFKKEDKLICVNNEGNVNRLTIGKEYVAEEDEKRIPHDEPMIKVVDDRGFKTNFYCHRFIPAPVEAAIIAPKVGDKVRCIAGIRASNLRRGRIYTIKKLGVKGNIYVLEEIAGRTFSRQRFELLNAAGFVAAPEQPPEVFISPTFKEGDKVIAYKVDTMGGEFHWAHDMYVAVEDKAVLTILNPMIDAVAPYRGHVRVTDAPNYIYPRHCLVFAEGPFAGLPELAKEGQKRVPIQPPKPKEPPKKDFAKILEDLREKVGKDTSHLNTWGMVFADGGKCVEKGAPCYYRINNRSNHALRGMVFSINNCDSLKIKGFDEWAQYVLYRSPVSDVFIQEDWDTYITKGVTVDVDRTISEIATAAIWIREGYEFGHKFPPVFQHFKELGYGENTAFLMSHMFQISAKGEYTKIGFGGMGHYGISGDTSYDHMIKFFQEGFFKKIGEPASKQIGRYQIFESIGDQVAKKRFDNVITDKLVYEMQGEGFHQKKILSKESVIEVAEFLHKQIN